MFKLEFTLQEAIALILTTALSAGGFYLLTFMLCLLVTSPIGLLVGVILLNVLNIWYHLSSLYTKVFNWTYAKVGAAMDWLNSRSFIGKIKSHARRTRNYVTAKLAPVFNFINTAKSKLFKKSDDVSAAIQIVNAEFVI